MEIDPVQMSGYEERFYSGQLSSSELAVLANTPLIPPPAGIESNFLDPRTRASLQVSYTSTFLCIASVFYLNRVYVKARLMRCWTWDDATLSIAMLLGIFMYAVQIYGVKELSLGRHLWDISIIQSFDPDILAIYYMSHILLSWALLFLKATFFILYLQIFGAIHWVRLACWISLVFIAISHIAIGIFNFVIANPYRRGVWQTHLIEVESRAIYVGLIIDVVIFLIPIIVIMGIKNMPTSRKIGILLLFATGFLAIIDSAFGVYFTHNLRGSADIYWDSVPVNIAVLSEISTGVVCACVPAASHGFRNSNSIYQMIIRKVLLYHRQLTSTRLPSRPSTRTHTGNERIVVAPRDVLRSTDRMYPIDTPLTTVHSMICPVQLQELPTLEPAHFAAYKRDTQHHMDV
ncbi:hypothetical protein BDV95DRAFT_610622 [Massariosphaeria phaeospora]|uniref:Rhodopsin domain-containing protein n=1 Tax=Massariosphaeria phaeospora TaxID=100035 RepID=A0A7C8M453_9PLEO|nr:hypothetical protein BDV95DRAFT_610622 [Massariosphaeria phaeospora]